MKVDGKTITTIPKSLFFLSPVAASSPAHLFYLKLRDNFLSSKPFALLKTCLLRKDLP